ncbi:hypothetical protein K469DRAFT_525668, partial [Zopfia rhizophila CBS 207.26]
PYKGYQGHFGSGGEAKAHRQSTRKAARPMDPNFQFIKHYCRGYWVERLYNAMIDVSDIIENKTSKFYTRFVVNPAFDQADMEATCHNIFDKAIGVYEKGWCRPMIYYKTAVRGICKDETKSLEERLGKICAVLKESKAACNDALEGGLPLRKLVDNPEQRRVSKASNNSGNYYKSLQIKAGRA